MGATGFYEWYQFHEAADGLVGPLLYARPGEAPGCLPVDPAAFYDFGETFVQGLVRRGVPATSFQNALYATSPFSQCALAGAEVIPFWEPGDALRLAAEVERGFAFVYLDAVDAACHAAGAGLGGGDGGHAGDARRARAARLAAAARHAAGRHRRPRARRRRSRAPACT